MNWLFRESKLGLESVVLLLFVMTMLILGFVLSTLFTGAIEYSVFGFYGITLFLFGFQIFALGKTPVGDAKQSLAVFIIGLIISLLGIVLCFTTSVPEYIPKYLIAAILGVSGVILFIRMLTSKNQYPFWKKSGDSLLMRLAFVSTIIYVFDILFALILILENIIPLTVKIVFAFLFGVILFWFTIIRQKTLIKYPVTSPAIGLDILSILILALYLITLGILMIPTNIGLIEFTGSAQLGLLMVIFAIQTIAIGNTPIGAFRRTNFVVILGITMAVLGITAIFVPDILVFTLNLLIGLLNIVSSLIFFIKNIPSLIKSKEPKDKISKQMSAASFAMNIFAFLFGLSMLISGLITGLAQSALLFLFGGALLYLLSRIIVLSKMTAETPQ